MSPLIISRLQVCTALRANFSAGPSSLAEYVTAPRVPEAACTAWVAADSAVSAGGVAFNTDSAGAALPVITGLITAQASLTLTLTLTLPLTLSCPSSRA